MRFRIALFRFLCSIIMQFSPVISNNTIPFCYFEFLIDSVFQMMPASAYFVIVVAFVKCLYSGSKTLPNGHATLKNVDSTSMQCQNVALTLIRRFINVMRTLGAPYFITMMTVLHFLLFVFYFFSKKKKKKEFRWKVLNGVKDVTLFSLFLVKASAIFCFWCMLYFQTIHSFDYTIYTKLFNLTSDILHIIIYKLVFFPVLPNKMCDMVNGYMRQRWTENAQIIFRAVGLRPLMSAFDTVE